MDFDYEGMGEKLYELRCDADITSRITLAEMLCEKGLRISSTTIQNLENGRYAPRFDFLIALAEMVSPEDPMRVIEELYEAAR